MTGITLDRYLAYMILASLKCHQDCLQRRVRDYAGPTPPAFVEHDEQELAEVGREIAELSLAIER